uniref:SLH domain-containing protein n=1 Tax=uncultured Bacillota bacterium TaxID=344338 RepID=A0A650EM90_9FIRM|nr:hypothetical protein Firmicute1046_0230 [uncultured Firmicutes bacterium]
MESRKVYRQSLIAVIMSFVFLFSAVPGCVAAAEEELYNYKLDLASGNLFSMMYGYSGGTDSGQPNLSQSFVSGRYGNALQITYYGYKITNAARRYNAYVMQFRSSKITVGEQEMDFVEYLKNVHTISFWVKTPKISEHSENMRDNRVIELIFETENVAGTGKYNKRIELPNTGEWAYISVPINDFNSFGDAVRAGDVKQMKQMSISFPYNDYFGCQPDDSTLENPWTEPLIIDEMLFDCYSAEYPAFTPPSPGEESYHTNARVNGIAVEGNPVPGFNSSASVNEVPVPRSYTVEDLQEQVAPILAAPPVEPDETHQRTSGASYVLETPEEIPGSGRLTVVSADKTETRTYELNFVYRDGLQVLTGEAQGIDFSEPLTAGDRNIMMRAVNESEEQSAAVQALAVVRDNQTGEVYSAASSDLLEIEPESRKWIMLSLTVPEDKDCSLTIYFTDGMERLNTVWQAVSTGGDTAKKQSDAQAVLRSIKAEADETEQKIKISGAVEQAGITEQALVVLTDSEGNLANVYAVGLTEGGFQSAFRYDADKMKGGYTVSVGIGGKVLTQEIYLSASDESAEIMRKFKKLSAQSSDAELLDFYTEQRNALMVSAELADSLTNSDKVAVMKSVLKENPATLETLRTAVRENSLLCVLNRAANGEEIYKLFDSYADIIQLETDKKYISDYLTEDSVWAVLLNELQGKNFKSIEAARKEFLEISLTYALNHMKNPNEAKALLEESADFLRNYMDYSGYERLVARGKQAGYYQLIFKNGINGLTELDTLLTQYSKSLEESSSGGGSGGGVSSGGGAVNNAFAVKSDKTEEEPLIPRPIEKPQRFDDLDSVPWAADAINVLAEIGVVSGKEEKSFAPNDSVTREEFTKLLVAALQMKADGAGKEFEDVPQGVWYSEPLRIASALGIVNGISEREFGIGESVTRQDIAAMAVRSLNSCGVSLPAVSQEKFADDDEIADYATESVYCLCAAGIINGTDGNRFAPGQFATRAEAAKIIYGVYEYCGRIKTDGGDAA